MCVTYIFVQIIIICWKLFQYKAKLKHHYFFFSTFYKGNILRKRIKKKTTRHIRGFPQIFVIARAEKRFTPTTDLNDSIHAYPCTNLKRYYARKGKLTTYLNVTNFISASEHLDMHEAGRVLNHRRRCMFQIYSVLRTHFNAKSALVIESLMKVVINPTMQTNGAFGTPNLMPMVRVPVSGFSRIRTLGIQAELNQIWYEFFLSSFFLRNLTRSSTELSYKQTNYLCSISYWLVTFYWFQSIGEFQWSIDLNVCS